MDNEDKFDVNFERADKLAILKDVLKAVDEKKQACLKGRWNERSASPLFNLVAKFGNLFCVFRTTRNTVRKFTSSKLVFPLSFGNHGE